MKFIKKEIVDGIAILRINRPEALNALNADLLKEIGEAVVELEKDSSLKVFILTGEGKAFVAGADIAAMAEYNEAQALEFSNLGQTVFSKLENSRLISIGLINGFALGGGLELALACDFRYASSKAKLGLPEVSLGLIPGFGGTQRLSRLIGIGLASEWVYSGEMFSAEQALSSGVVNRVVEPEELLNEGMKVAQSIRSRGSIAIQSAKKVIRDGLNSTVDEGMVLEQKKFASLFGTPESKEGMSAFLGKRKPNF
ncbi:enoyl-CoA hydratase/isomerase family protein [Leptospira sp. GIMC2001]|uniref:enoyl-CoA hydratase/isomerase family protein n=1 Tax=Leptospira sp. GIMC2001 TaxID=1513297 RepID=UPI00234A9B98|nr:enoyl-CoA hydratase-related protein [Leptospira sp. GIMC2001]WCL50266.1 enoyl-CoA hydratase-related protein [Leptospira sp. GIMC2001]